MRKLVCFVFTVTLLYHAHAQSTDEQSIRKILNDQIAAWNAEQRAWVDSYLNFRGRIDRDEWVKQADALARGGEEEYVRVFGKKPR